MQETTSLNSHFRNENLMKLEMKLLLLDIKYLPHIFIWLFLALMTKQYFYMFSSITRRK